MIFFFKYKNLTNRTIRVIIKWSLRYYLNYYNIFHFFMHNQMALSASYDIESPTTVFQNATQNYLGIPDMKKLTLTQTKNSPTAS